MSAGSSSRKGPPRAWQRMLSGRRLDLLAPSPLDVELEDIDAVALCIADLTETVVTA